MQELINRIISMPMGYIMRVCFEFLNDYGRAIVLFTLLTKVVLFPLSVWVHKNSIKMIRIQPEVNEIRARNIGNAQKALEEQQQLYKRVKYKPLAGIIPTMIQIPIVISLISVINHPLQHLLQIDGATIEVLVAKAAEILQQPIEAVGQLQVVNLIQSPIYTGRFVELNSPSVTAALSAIRTLNMRFGTLLLTNTPQLSNAELWKSGENWMPIAACLSAFLLSWSQNAVNILQKEAKWFSRWGMAIFLTLFSLYFGCVVPAGVALYWIFSNLFAVLVMLVTYWIIPPRKYIDYDALEESKAVLARSKAAEACLAQTPEQKKRAKADYQRFCNPSEPMKIVFYSEKSGFYRYFSAIIDNIVQRSDLVVHYVTSDPNDIVFEKQSPRLQPYYMDEQRLILAFMKADADMMVMTMPDLGQYHLKRSYLRKDMEYVYVYHAMIVGPQTVRKGATQYYDTLLCTGEEHMRMEKVIESYYHWTPRKAIACGYPLLDEMIASYEKQAETAKTGKKKILIAPSYQPDNIMDSCLIPLITALCKLGYGVTLRPHPQYIKLFPMQFADIVNQCAAFEGDGFQIETDFGSNDTVYNADLLITDWSSIAYEYAFTTLKPVLFIDTPMKVINPDYLEYGLTNPADIRLRNVVGISMTPDRIPNDVGEIAVRLIQSAADYSKVIADARAENVCNLGHSAEIAATYIIERITKGEEIHE